jgi:hypothetical protein
MADGAAAVLLGTEAAVRRAGLRPRARILASADACVPLAQTGAVDATRRALSRAGLGVDDIELWEVRDSFAAITLHYIDTLGVPLELDSLLRGETLPPYAGIGAVLFHMATNHAFDPTGMREVDFYLGQTEGQHIWLLYKPDLDWLKSPEAALTLTRAKAISETAPEKRHLVFAPARFVSQKMLTEQKIQVEFVPLPDALYRIDRS